MYAEISHAPLREKSAISDRTLFLVACLYAVPLAGLIWWKPLLAVAFVLAPILLLVVSYGPLLVGLVIVASFTFFPIESVVTMLPADLVAMALAAAYLADLFINGRTVKKNVLLGPFVVYLCVAFVSIALELFTLLSIRFFLRQLLYLVTFLATAHFARRADVHKYLLLFVLAAVANSLLSLSQFLSAGGAIRAFGLAGKGYGDHAMLAFLISAMYYLWTDDIRKRIWWASAALIALGAIAATQTRAPAITAGWGLLVGIVTTLVMSRRINASRPRINLVTAVILALLVFPLIALYTPVFAGITHRFGRMGFQASETILLRMSLWKAALAAFWAHPVLGIGSGNFSQVKLWVPEVKFDPIFAFVSGLGTHSVIMSVLAETGLIGLMAFFNFFTRPITAAFRNLFSVNDRCDMPAAISLFVIAVVILGSSFYAGAWFWGNNGFHMAVFFGLIVAFQDCHTGANDA